MTPTGRHRVSGLPLRTIGSPIHLTHEFGPRDEQGLRPTVSGNVWLAVAYEHRPHKADLILFSDYERGL